LGKKVNGELKQAMTMVAMRTSPNKRFNGQNNSCAHALYISLVSSAKQQRKMTKFCVVKGMRTRMANFSHFHLELNAGNAYLA